MPSNLISWAFIITVVITMFGRRPLQRWLMREHQAGRMSGRKAGWLFGATLAAPWLVFVIYTALRDIGTAVILALMFLAIGPVMIIPWVAVFRYPDDQPE